MGFIRSQLLEVIEWKDDSRDTVVYQFPVGKSEIKNGASLTVRESQVAVFVSEGQIADIFGPGLHRLETKNIPVLTKLNSWKYGFNSPFKAEVYFVNIRQFTDNKWGTASPIMKEDEKFGVVRLKAFGSFLFQVGDPAIFVRECLGTPKLLTKENIIQHLRSSVVSAFGDVIGTTQFSALSLASKYTEIGYAMKEEANKNCGTLGIAVSQVIVENISLPAEVEKMLDNRTSMNILGTNMNQYTQYQTANMIGDAAKNPNSMGSFAAGLATIGVMNQAVNQQQQPRATQVLCPHCGSQCNEGVKFCGNCGKTLKINTVNCPACKATISEGLKFCPECGTNLVVSKPKECPKCNTAVPSGNRFCINCGTKIE